MEVIFACFVIAYCVLVICFHYYWLQIPVFHRHSDFSVKPCHRRLSVIIPVRNEARHIVSLLEDLQQQQLSEGTAFPPDCWEVIVVDDDSEDETVALVEKFQSQATYSLQLLRCEYCDSSQSPKKRALWKGIQAARGDTIVTTDGDCRVGPYWLSTWMQFFQIHQPALVAGGVTFYQESSWFQRLQTLEFASLIGIGAASIQRKMPITCNGANLAFSREAFKAVNGYEGHWHIPSGDDEFLLHAMFRQFPNRIYFIKSSEVVVKTQAKRRVTAFFQQRKRWAGKWKMHRAGYVAIIATLVFVYHLTFLSIGGYIILGGAHWYWVICLIFLKVGLEYAFLSSVLKFLKKDLNPLNFMGLQLLYSAYFVLIGIAASMSGYTWKKRKYTNHDGPGIRRDG